MKAYSILEGIEPEKKTFVVINEYEENDRIHF